MSRLSISLLALILISAVSAPTAAARAPAPVNRYIVVLKSTDEDPGAVAAEHARRFGAQVSHVYRSALRGYSAAIP